MAALSILIDTEEPRVVQDRISVTVVGAQDDVLGWDMDLSSGTFLDAVTWTGMLLPNQIGTTTWTRLRKANYPALAVLSDWVERVGPGTDDVYLHGLGVNTAATTSEVFDRNRGFWVSYWQYGTNERFASLYARVGDMGFEFWADGTVNVYRPVTSFSAGWSTPVASGSIAEKAGRSSSVKGKSAGNSVGGLPVDVLILPCRHNEVVVLSNRGGGFSVIREDIAQADANPTITASDTFAWWSPTMQASVQAGVLTYATSGTLISEPIELPRAPAVGQSATVTAHYDLPGYGTGCAATGSVLEVDGVTAFVPDGLKTACRLAVTLTGSGANTPFVYGATATWDAVLSATDGTDEVELTAYPYEATLEFGEDPGSTKFSVTANGAAALETAIPNAGIIGNRPIQAWIGTCPVFAGRSGSPSYDEHVDDDMTSITWECGDEWAAMDRYLIQDDVPLDGLALSDVFEMLAQMPGYASTNMDVADLDYTLPVRGGASQGEWAQQIKAGDRAAEVATRLREEFCGTTVMGWAPVGTGRRFRVRTREGIGTTPDVTIYSTTAAAVAAVGAALAPYRVFRTFKEESIEPEANVVRVTGWDSRTGRMFQATSNDAASMDPTTAPSSRPDNWLGEPRRVAQFDPGITTLADATYVAALLKARLGSVRYVATWDCEMLLKADGAPVWRGDLVRLDGVATYRILSGSTRFRCESASPEWRPTTYTGERIG